MKPTQSAARVAVLISGGGTNLQAIIDSRKHGNLDIDLVVVLSNKTDAFGLERSREAGIETRCVPHSNFPARNAFDAELAQTLDAFRPDLVLLAGFMRVLTPAFVTRYEGRLLNIHPSLLPRYPGLDTHRRAIEAGDSWHGSTVHFVTEELDGGPRIIQGRVPILPDDKPAQLAERVLAIEHRIYPRAIQLITEGRIAYADGAAWLDGKKLLEPLQL